MLSLELLFSWCWTRWCNCFDGYFLNFPKLSTCVGQCWATFSGIRRSFTLVSWYLDIQVTQHCPLWDWGGRPINCTQNPFHENLAVSALAKRCRPAMRYGSLINQDEQLLQL